MYCAEMHGALRFSFMFEKWTKKFASKATDSAIEGAKMTLNDRIDEYGDIIRVGLVLAVIVFGGRHLTKQQNDPMPMPIQTMHNPYIYNPPPLRLPQGTGQPIIVNNYYREREVFDKYAAFNKQKRQTGKNYPKR